MRKGKRDVPQDRFVKIPHEWILSAAWKTLSPRAVWAFVMLIDGYQEARPGTYVLPSRKISWGCRWGALRDALDELTAAGFIVCIEDGGLNRKPDVYRLSDGWKNRSAAIMADDAQGKTQGKFKEWIPSRPKRILSQASLKNLRQNKGKRAKRKMMIEAPAKATDRDR